MKNKIKITILEKENKPSPFAENLLHNEYKLKLSYKGNEYNFTFHDSVYNYQNNKKLNKDEAVYSLLTDARCFEQARDEKEFLNEFGYDEFDLYNYYQNGYSFSDMYEFAADKDVDNLRKGLKAYKECEKTYNALQNMFTSDELSQLYTEFENY